MHQRRRGQVGRGVEQRGDALLRGVRCAAARRAAGHHHPHLGWQHARQRGRVDGSKVGAAAREENGQLWGRGVGVCRRCGSGRQPRWGSLRGWSACTRPSRAAAARAASGEPGREAQRGASRCQGGRPRVAHVMCVRRQGCCGVAPCAHKGQQRVHVRRLQPKQAPPPCARRAGLRACTQCSWVCHASAARYCLVGRALTRC